MPKLVAKLTGTSTLLVHQHCQLHPGTMRWKLAKRIRATDISIPKMRGKTTYPILHRLIVFCGLYRSFGIFARCQCRVKSLRAILMVAPKADLSAQRSIGQ